MARPVCARLGDAIEQAAREQDLRFVRGGTYLAMEGPQFSTLAESELYRTWNCDVIGMTNMPEAKLAREAELCYATVAMVTDYDCWHPQHDDVTVQMVIATLLQNADKARGLVERVAPKVAALDGPCPRGCHAALEHALITPEHARDPLMVERLSAVAGRVLERSTGA
jgi:5'-methylthioadenosine phosphorylase